MIIKGYDLLSDIETSIIEYNDQFFKPEDEEKKIPFFEYSEDGESADIPEETLSKLKDLRISIFTRNVKQEETQNILNQLPKLLDVMKLNHFSFTIREGKNKTIQLDTSFLDHLNNDIKYIGITGIDLSKEEPSKFERFKDLNSLNLWSCNISDPKIISAIKPEVLVSLERNKIAPEYYEDALKLIQSSNGRIKFSNKNLNSMSQIYSTKQVNLNDYLRLMNTIDFDNISELTINLEDGFDFENSDNEQIINLLNEKTNIALRTTPTNLSSLDPNGLLNLSTRVVIKNASELDSEELLKHKCISSVQTLDGDNTMEQQKEPYTREEYEKIRTEINKIISQVDFPESNDPNREKKLFAQIYKILGERIDYDNNAISEEEKNNERLQITCRNLLGPLLENKGVCAGYADSLRNVLACVGIYSEFVSGSPDFDNGVPINLKDPSGHAWNLVLLDGQKYWTDLTWDANNIKTGRYPLKYCLKSTKQFNHDTFNKRIEDAINDPCLENISDEEQIMLFTGKELPELDANKKQENKNIGYLSNCVMSIADSGLTSTMVRKTANEINTLSITKETETEVSDGRY